MLKRCASGSETAADRERAGMRPRAAGWSAGSGCGALFVLTTGV